jgi:hypothetical protein
VLPHFIVILPDFYTYMVKMYVGEKKENYIQRSYHPANAGENKHNMELTINKIGIYPSI